MKREMWEFKCFLLEYNFSENKSVVILIFEAPLKQFHLFLFCFVFFSSLFPFFSWENHLLMMMKKNDFLVLFFQVEMKMPNSRVILNFCIFHFVVVVCDENCRKLFINEQPSMNSLLVIYHKIDEILDQI